MGERGEQKDPLLGDTAAQGLGARHLLRRRKTLFLSPLCHPCLDACHSHQTLMPRVEGDAMQRGLLDAEFKMTADAFRIFVDLFAHGLHWGSRALSSPSFPLGPHIACQTESQYPGHCISSVSETNPSLSVRDSWVLQRGSETSQ